MMKSCKSFNQFQKLLNNDELRSKCLEQFRKSTKIKLSGESPDRKSAVLVPLIFSDDRVSILYTVRSTNLRTHRGQVSFPGGIFDNEDKDKAANCALRETFEEIGLQDKDIHIWGEGEQMIMRLNLSITPVIGTVENFNENKLSLNKTEVERVFTVPVDDLINPIHRKYTQFKQNYTAPIFFVGGERIWGMTAIITHIFLMTFLPRDIYYRKLGFVSKYLAS